eukprot:2784321-Rhodomonas_salina.1
MALLAYAICGTELAYRATSGGGVTCALDSDHRLECESRYRSTLSLSCEIKDDILRKLSRSCESQGVHPEKSKTFNPAKSDNLHHTLRNKKQNKKLRFLSRSGRAAFLFSYLLLFPAPFSDTACRHVAYVRHVTCVWRVCGSRGAGWGPNVRGQTEVPFRVKE